MLNKSYSSTNDGLTTAFNNFKHYLLEVGKLIAKPWAKPKLEWATARLDPSNCATYTVDIRYHCINWGFNNKTELAKFDELCNELLPQVSIFSLVESWETI